MHALSKCFAFREPLESRRYENEPIIEIVTSTYNVEKALADARQDVPELLGNWEDSFEFNVRK